MPVADLKFSVLMIHYCRNMQNELLKSSEVIIIEENEPDEVLHRGS